MALWNDIQKGLNDATSFTTKKTTELTDSAKSKYNLYNLKNKLEKCYATLGRHYLDTRRNEEDHEFEILTLIMQIDKIESDIAYIKSKAEKEDSLAEDAVSEETEISEL